MYHLVTHAFFKALLFLAAGSVIMALHHEQNIWKMGGLRQKMPVTWWVFLIGLLALCGVPPLSGFYSKDSILAVAFLHNKPLFAVGVVTAVLTAFYVGRLFCVALLGRARSPAAGQAVESKAVMTFPLILLALGSIAGGFLGLEAVLLKVLPGPAQAEAPSWLQAALGPFRHSPQTAFCGLAAVGVGFLAALALYRKAEEDPLRQRMAPVARVLANRFYFDELYAWLNALTHELVSRVVDWLDRWILAGCGVKGASGALGLLGSSLRLVQTGNLQTYAFLIAIGLALLFWLVLR